MCFMIYMCFIYHNIYMCFITPFIHASFIYSLRIYMWFMYTEADDGENRSPNEISLLYHNVHAESKYTESVCASYTLHNIQYMPFINYVNIPVFLMALIFVIIYSLCVHYICIIVYIFTLHNIMSICASCHTVSIHANV